MLESVFSCAMFTINQLGVKTTLGFVFLVAGCVRPMPNDKMICSCLNPPTPLLKLVSPTGAAVLLDPLGPRSAPLELIL